MFDRIFEKLEEQSMVIAAGATVVNTASGEDLLVPKVTTNPTGALVTEGGSIGEQDVFLARSPCKPGNSRRLLRSAKSFLLTLHSTLLPS
jgi:hypothetical protein